MLFMKVKNQILMLSEVEYLQQKQHKEKGRLSDLACIAKVFDRTRLKILTPKQMLKRLSIALAQLKAGNTSESLLNEIG